MPEKAAYVKECVRKLNVPSPQGEGFYCGERRKKISRERERVLKKV